MTNPLKNINWNILSRGDKVIWAFTVILLIASILGVISTGTISEINVWGVIWRYMRDLLITIAVMYVAYLIPYDYYRPLAKWSIIIVIPLLLWASFSGVKISGQSAGRWIKIFGFSFQPSGLALISMVMYVAVWMEKYFLDHTLRSAREKWILYFWLPVAGMFFLIIWHNLSTGIIFAATFYILLFLGGFSWRQTFISILVLMAAGMSIYGTYKVAPEKFESSRISTWVSRIDSFFEEEKETETVEYSSLTEEQKRKLKEKEDKEIQGKASLKAVALGVASPAGPGKSTQKYFLSQADSDFIFAIMVEEYGIAGGFAILLCFLVILIRMIMQVFRSEDMFSLLTLSGLLCVMMLQAIIHMCVVVGFIPVTGQNLPFISSGGTSVMMSCLGITIMQKIIAHRQSVTLLRKQMEQKESSEDETPNEEDEEEEYTETALHSPEEQTIS